MSFALQHAKDSIDVMNVQERLDLLQYLAPKLKPSEVKKPPHSIAVDITPDLGSAPTASQVLTEMRDARDCIRSVTDNPEANWKRLQELGREMDSKVGSDKSLLEILSEMRG